MSSPEGSSVLNLSRLRISSLVLFPLHSSDDVVELLKELEESQSSN